MTADAKKRSGGGAVIANDGLDRCTEESAKSLPESYTVLDVDISEEDLRKRYPNNEVAQAYITAAKQANRNYRPPSKAFVRSLYPGVVEPVVYIPLGPDRYGKAHALIFSGNKRVVGSRISNEERKGDGLPPNLVRGIRKTFAGTAAEKGAKALDLKAVSNVREVMTVCDRAELAAEYAGWSMPLDDVLIRVGASNEREYKDLVALAGIMPQLSKRALAAVDAGTVRLRKAQALAKMGKAEQDADLAGEKPKGERKPRPKPAAAPALPWEPKRTTHFIERLEEENYASMAVLVRILSGAPVPDGVPEDLAEILDEMGIAIPGARAEAAE